MATLEPITSDPNRCHGQPMIGDRYPVLLLLDLLAAGIPLAELLADHPTLTAEDLCAALEYTAASPDYRAWLAFHAA